MARITKITEYLRWSLLAAVFALTAAIPSAMAAGGTLIVNVTLDNPDGDKHGYLRMGVFNNEEAWLKDGMELTGEGRDMPGAMNEQYVFKNLAAGRYAVGVYIDENDNQEADTNLFGAPTESVGMSNNPSFFFSPPSFDESSVELADGETLTLNIVIDN